MMSFKQLFAGILFLGSAAFAHAQLIESWTTDLDGNLVFQKVTATGNFLVSTSGSLTAYDPDSGTKLWSNADFASLAEEQLTEINGSPLLLINASGSISILDPFTGKEKFNSTKAGFSELKFQQMMYQTNGVLIAGTKGESDPAMTLVDLATGNQRWEIDEKFGKLISAKEFSEKEMLVIALFNAYRINSDDGSIVWKEATSAEAARMQDAGALGALLQGVSEKMAADMDFVVKYFPQPKKNRFVIGAEAKKELTSHTSDEPTIVFENNYTAFDMTDGRRLWEESVTLKGKLGELAFYKNGVILLPDDGNRTIINYVDFDSGEGQWGKNGRGTKIKGGVYDYIETSKGLLLISGKGSNTFLSFLDPASGELTFDKPVKVSGDVVRTFESGAGLGFVTTEEFDILNTTSGELVLSSTLNTQPSLVDDKDGFLYVFETKKGLVYRVDGNSGATEELTSDKLKFDGREDPKSLELRDNGIFVSSDQNVALFDYSGKLVYQNYYQAPGESGLKKTLLVAQAVRAAYIGANAYVAAGTLQAAAPAVTEEDAVSGAMVEGFGRMYEDLGNAASDFAKESLKRATQRFRATAEGRDFLIMLSKTGDGNALLKVNKNTGQVDASISLGKDKEPRYAVDDVMGKVFLPQGDSQIACYDL